MSRAKFLGSSCKSAARWRDFRSMHTESYFENTLTFGHDFHIGRLIRFLAVFSTLIISSGCTALYPISKTPDTLEYNGQGKVISLDYQLLQHKVKIVELRDDGYHKFQRDYIPLNEDARQGTMDRSPLTRPESPTERGREVADILERYGFSVLAKGWKDIDQRPSYRLVISEVQTYDNGQIPGGPTAFFSGLTLGILPAIGNATPSRFEYRLENYMSGETIHQKGASNVKIIGGLFGFFLAPFVHQQTLKRASLYEHERLIQTLIEGGALE